MKLKFTQKAMNKKLNKILPFIVPVFVLLIGFFLGTYFYIKNNNESVSAYNIDDCMTVVASDLKDRSMNFMAFLDIHFSSKQSNTYLIPDAVAAYMAYKKGIMKMINNYEAGVDYKKDQASNLATCKKIALNEIENAKTILINHAKKISYVKHGMIFTEKYNNINNELSELNTTISKVVGAYEGFYEKFPGYATDCLTTN